MVPHLGIHYNRDNCVRQNTKKLITRFNETTIATLIYVSEIQSEIQSSLISLVPMPDYYDFFLYSLAALSLCTRNLNTSCVRLQKFTSILCVATSACRCCGVVEYMKE
ncbi:hypothetical protein GQX74_011184 [Glossina fuscipes]|nr:hypothetical protein GQX74_011184 [Glossina fuscipes]